MLRRCLDGDTVGSARHTINRSGHQTGGRTLVPARPAPWVRTRWEGYGDQDTFQADSSQKAASYVPVIGPLGNILRGVDRGRQGPSVVRLIGGRHRQPHLPKLMTADRSSHPSRCVATYATYASENLTKHWCSPVSSPTAENTLGSLPRRDRNHGAISGGQPLLRLPGVWSRSNKR